jgi:chromosome partitioning protein
MIIGILNQKGGVGKTTLSINLAHALMADGSKALLVDADPQASALAWSAARNDDPLFPVVGMAKPTLHKDLPKVAQGFDHVIIDGAPRVNELGRATIIASDLILIPVQPSPYDVWASEETVDLIREAQQFKESLKAAFAINRKIVNTAIGRDVVDALAGYDFTVLDAAVSQRVGFAESAAQGRTVFETDKNGAAAREITALTNAITSEMKIRRAA